MHNLFRFLEPRVEIEKETIVLDDVSSFGSTSLGLPKIFLSEIDGPGTEAGLFPRMRTLKFFVRGDKVHLLP